MFSARSLGRFPWFQKSLQHRLARFFTVVNLLGFFLWRWAWWLPCGLMWRIKSTRFISCFMFSARASFQLRFFRIHFSAQTSLQLRNPVDLAILSKTMELIHQGEILGIREENNLIRFCVKNRLKLWIRGGAVTGTQALLYLFFPFLHQRYQIHCRENPIYVLPEKKPHGLRPSFHIHVSVSDLYIPTIGPSIFLLQKRQTVGIYKLLTETWMQELCLRPRSFISGNICFEFLVYCLCSVLASMEKTM